jgi:hypothetical protein
MLFLPHVLVLFILLKDPVSWIQTDFWMFGLFLVYWWVTLVWVKKQNPNGYIMQVVRVLNLWQGTEGKSYSLQVNPHVSFRDPQALKTHEPSADHP